MLIFIDVDCWVFYITVYTKFLMKLNKSNVDSIVLTEKGQTIYQDSDLIGFAVRATKLKVKCILLRDEV